VAARVVTGDSEPAAAVLGCLVFGAFVAAVGAAPWFALIPLFTLLFASSDSFAFACAVALALSLRWTPWRPAEPGPVPRTTEL